MKDPQESLKKWGDQKWRTSDGKPSKGKKRYLPDAAWDKLSQKEKDATNQAKARGNAKGKQFVAQPKAIAKKKVHRMESVAKPILFTAASKMMRELLKNGYKIERGAANASSQLSGDVMTIRRAAPGAPKTPLSEFWHEAGHALDMHGTPEGLKRATAFAEAQAAQKATGAAPDLAYRQQTRDLERRANRTAEQAMVDRGATEGYVQKYRNEVAPHLNDYRNANSVAQPRAPISGTAPMSPATPAAPATPQPPSVNPSAPIKRSFGGLGMAATGVGAVGIGAAAYAASGDKPRRKQPFGFSSPSPLITFERGKYVRRLLGLEREAQWSEAWRAATNRNHTPAPGGTFFDPSNAKLHYGSGEAAGERLAVRTAGVDTGKQFDRSRETNSLRPEAGTEHDLKMYRTPMSRDTLADMVREKRFKLRLYAQHPERESNPSNAVGRVNQQKIYGNEMVGGVQQMRSPESRRELYRLIMRQPAKKSYGAKNDSPYARFSATGRTIRFAKKEYKDKAKLPSPLIQLGVVSNQTAKKVLKQLRASGMNPKRIRPIDPFVEPHYQGKGTNTAAIMSGDTPFPAHSVVIPREPKRKGGILGWIRKKLESNPTPMEKIKSDKVGIAIHEHAHATDPVFGTVGAESNQIKDVLRRTRLSGVSADIDREMFANRAAKAAIKQHGTPEEVLSWDRFAQKQMKHGYRNPAFEHEVKWQKAKTLSQKKAIFKDMPEIRRQALSSRSPLIQLASAAWQRKEGKSASGGLNRKGVASYRRENPGSKLKTAVTTEPSKLKPGSKPAKRRKSFCARMSGMQGPMKKPNGEPTRKALSLRKWNCSSKTPLIQLGIDKPIIFETAMSQIQDLSRRLEGIMEFARMDYHKVFAPDSDLHRSPQERALRDAVAKNKPRDRRSAMHAALRENDITQSPESIARINNAGRPFAEKHGKNSPERRIAESMEKQKIKREWDTKTISERGAGEDKMGTAKGRKEIMGPFLDRRIEATRRYAASELLESRDLIKGYAKARGLKIGDAYREARANPGMIPQYRSALNTEATAIQNKAQRKLGKYTAIVKRHIGRQILKTADPVYTSHLTPSAGGLRLLPSSLRADDVFKAIAPINPHALGTEPLSKIESGVVEKLFKPKGRGKSLLNQTRDRLKILTDAAGQGHAYRAAAKDQVLKSGKIFQKPLTEAAQVAAAPTGFPHLKKIGIGAAALAGLTAAGIYAKKRYDQNNQPVAMSSRGRLIQFGKFPKIKGKALKKLADNVPIWKKQQAEKAAQLNNPRQPKAGYTTQQGELGTGFSDDGKLIITEGFLYPEGVTGHGPRKILSISEAGRRRLIERLEKIKRNNQYSAEPSKGIVSDNSAAADKAASSVERAEIDDAAINRAAASEHKRLNPHAAAAVSQHAARQPRQSEFDRGYMEGAGDLTEAQATILRKTYDAAAMEGELIGANQRATRRLIGGIGGITAAGGAGLYIGSRKKEPVQFASKNDSLRNNPALTAGLSAGITGALLGTATGLQRGVTARMVGRNAIIGGGLAAGLVGGGVIIGNRIFGNPGQSESIPITKRAAVGGTILGAVGGLGAGLIANKTRYGKAKLAELASATGGNWRPALWAKKSGVIGAMGIGAGTGALVGGYQSADEGQQVDTIRALMKERRLSAKGRVIQLAAEEDELIAKRMKHTSVGPDRYKKKIVDDEHNRRDANYGRTAAVGALLGAQFRKSMNIPLGRAALVGAGAGLATQAIIRNAGTKNVRDKFGEKTITAKRVEMAPWVAGAGLAAAVAGRRIYKASPTAQRIVAKYFSAKVRTIQLDEISDRMEDQRSARRMIYGRPRRVYPQAETYYRNIRRAGDVFDTAKSVATGNPNLDARGREKTPVYKKPWVLATAGASVIGVGLLARRKVANVIRNASPDSGIGKLRDVVSTGSVHKFLRDIIPGGKKVSTFLKGTQEEVKRVIDPAAGKLADRIAANDPEYVNSLIEINKNTKKAADALRTNKQAAKNASDIATGKKIFSSRMKPIQFQTDPQYVIDHVRGARRSKYITETTGFQRAALAAAVLGGGGMGVYALRGMRGVRAASKAEGLLAGEANAIEKAKALKEAHKAANIIEGDFRKRAGRGPGGNDPNSPMAASSKLKPIHLESRRDPEERLRDKLSIASSLTGTAAGLGVLGGTGYLLHKMNKNNIIERGGNAIDTLAEGGATMREAGNAAIKIEKKIPNLVRRGPFREAAKGAQARLLAMKLKHLGRKTLGIFGFSACSPTVRFEQKKRDYAAASAAGAGVLGTIGASQYIGGRKHQPGEDLRGRRIVRRSVIIPGGYHEGIGSESGKVTHVTDVGTPGKRNVRIVEEPVEKFLAGRSGRVLDKEVSSAIAEKAKARVGNEFKGYNLFTNNCSSLTDCIRGGRKRIVSRQWERALIGGAAGAAVGYGTAKLIAANRKKEMSAKGRVINFAKKKDEGMSTGRKIAIGGGAAAIGVGSIAAARAANPYVGLTHGYVPGEYRGHIAASEKAQKLLNAHGVKTKMIGSSDGVAGGLRGVLASVESRSGYGMAVPFSKSINSHPDVFSKSEPVPVGMPSKIRPSAGRNTKRTIGVYGGAVGVDVGDKIEHLAKVADRVDRIHLYGGANNPPGGRSYIPGGHDRVKAKLEELRATNPKAAEKFRLHGPMKPKAFARAMQSHTINVSNNSGNTMQEISTTNRPFVVWNQHDAHYTTPHFVGNQEWYKSRGSKVAEGATGAARGESALAHLNKILDSHTNAAPATNEVAATLTAESAKRQAEFVKEAKSALKRSRVANTLTAGALGIAGAGAIAAGIHRSEKREKRLSSRGRLIRFDQQEDQESGRSKLKRAALIAGGLGVAGLGVAALPAAIPMGKILARTKVRELRTKLAGGAFTGKFFNAPKPETNSAGRMVADYIESANTLMNRGVTGAITGKLLSHVKKHPKGFIARNLGMDNEMARTHYEAFRRGPVPAAKHWDYEYGGLLEHRVKQASLPRAQRAKGWENETANRTSADRTHRIMARGRKDIFGSTPYDGAINDVMARTGKNEMDALRHVAEGKHTYTASEEAISAVRKAHAAKSPYPSSTMSREEAAGIAENQSRKDTNTFFRNIAAQNASASEKYAKMFVASPAAIVAGTGITAAGIYGTRRDSDGRKLRQVDYLPNRLKELSSKLDSILLAN